MSSSQDSWVCNGLLITSAAPGVHTYSDSIYQGVACGTPWPLDRQDDDLSRELTDAVDKLTLYQTLGNDTYPPAVLSDLDLIMRYLRQCHACSIAVRLLLCETQRSWPELAGERCDALMPHSTFLGCDYAYSSCTFSAVASDLHNPPPDEALQRATHQRNQYGLFDTEEMLQEYIEARWRYLRLAGETFVQQGTLMVRQTPLEDSGDFVALRVYELPPESIHV